jgi:prophage maintenance system killer protein
MNTTKEILHHSLLSLLDTNRTRFGFQAATLVLQLRGLAITASKDEVIDALEYLASRMPPLVEETRPEIDRENRAWKINEAGIRYADEHVL